MNNNNNNNYDSVYGAIIMTTMKYITKYIQLFAAMTEDDVVEDGITDHSPSSRACCVAVNGIVVAKAPASVTLTLSSTASSSRRTFFTQRYTHQS